MIAKFLRASMLVVALAAAGCTDSSFEDISPKAEKQLSPQILQAMKTKGMTRTSPVVGRIFKEEGKFEVWKQKNNGRYDLIASYDICKWSGQLGPKYREGDRQAPEGFYTVRPGQMNPNSSYHLAFNIGYPNAYDRAHGRGGSNLMVHGDCSSSGCYSMNNGPMEEIYAFAREAFRGGQTEFQIQAFPFRMTAANMKRYANDPNIEFWKMLKEGYDHFEITKVPPKVDVCEKRYVFNRVTEGNGQFSATAACPPSSQPAALMSAYQGQQSSDAAALAGSAATDAPPRPSINGIKEANLVAEWSKKRARGERVSMDPPSLEHDGSVSVTSRMGRIDSAAGRRMAAIDAENAEKQRAADEKKRLAEEKKIAEALAKAAAAAPAPAAVDPAATATTEVEATAEAPAKKPGLLGGVTRRIGNIFGS